MDSSNSLPIYSAPIDHLRFGLNSLESEQNQQHPVAQLQKSCVTNEWNEKLDHARRQYGSHMAMRLATEKQLFNRNHRLPGLQHSSISTDILMGKEFTIDFMDVLNGMLLYMV